jgi:hypothetical protein
MMESVRDNATNASAASVSDDSVYTLAPILECEFDELHQSDPPKVTHEAPGQNCAAPMEANRNVVLLSDGTGNSALDAGGLKWMTALRR